MFRMILVTMTLATVTAGIAQAQLIDKTALTLDGAKKIAAAAEAKAKTEGARVVIAVVDEGGLSVIAPDGTLLGTIETGRPTSNVAWGEDGHTLFITGGASVYRLRLTTTGTEY